MDIDRYKACDLTAEERRTWNARLNTRLNIIDTVNNRVMQLKKIVRDDLGRELYEDTSVFLCDLARYYKDYVLEAMHNNILGQRSQIRDLIPLLWPTAQGEEYGGPSPKGDIVEVSCDGNWKLFTYSLANVAYQGQHLWTRTPASKLLWLMQDYRASFEPEYVAAYNTFEARNEAKRNEAKKDDPVKIV